MSVAASSLASQVQKLLKGSLDEAIKPYRGNVRRATAYGAVYDLCGIVRPLIYMTLIDRLLQNISIVSISILAVLLLLIAAVEGLFSFLREHSLAMSLANASLQIGGRSWAGIFHAKRSAYNKWRNADLVEAVGGLTPFFVARQSLHFAVWVGVPVTIILAAILFLINPVLASIYIVSAPILVFYSHFFAAQRQKVFLNSFEENLSYRSTAIEMIGGLDVLRSFAASDFAFRRVWRHYAPTIVEGFHSSRIGSYLTKGSAGFQSIFTVLILFVSAVLVSKNIISVGPLVAFDVLSSQLKNKFSLFSSLISTIQSGSAAQEKTNHLIHQIGDLHQDSIDKKVSKDSISIRDVFFSYAPNDTNILRGVSLHLKPGIHVGLAGGSGEGKTTLGRIAAGVITPLSGEVNLDNDDRKFQLSDFVNYIPQESFVFSGTVIENVLLKNFKEINEEDIDNAMSALRLSGLSSELSIHDKISEGGRNISGGQRQRLHISRIFCVPPKATVLDEPTSALSDDMSRILMLNIRQYLKDEVLLVISHDQTTLNGLHSHYRLMDGELGSFRLSEMRAGV